MTNEERIEALEREVAALVYAASPQAAYERLKIVFPGGAETVVTTDAKDRSNPPAVVSHTARKLAWFKDRGWYAIWIADNKTVVAPVKKVTTPMVWGACKKVQPGEFIYGRMDDLSPDWVIEDIISNPYVPESCGGC